MCKKLGLFLVTFQNKKKRREERKNIIFYLYMIIYCLRSMSWFTFLCVCVCVCVCVWFLPTFQYRTPKKKQKKLTTDFFSLCVLFSQIREFALWIFINYAYICAWMHVHGRHLKETVLWATITWSEMGKTYRTYKLKSSIPTCCH